MWPHAALGVAELALAPGTRFAVAQSGLVRHNGLRGIGSR